MHDNAPDLKYGQRTNVDLIAVFSTESTGALLAIVNVSWRIAAAGVPAF
jgi:hypothetical protein